MPLFFEYSIFFPYYFGIKLGLNPWFQSNHIILPNEYPILSASYPQYLPVYPHCLHIFRACPSWGLSLCPRLHRAAKASKGSPEKYWNQDLQCRLIKFGSREREREFRNRPWTGGFFSGTNTITRLIGILMAYSWNCNGIQKGLVLYVKVRMLFQPHQLGKNHVPRWHGGYSGWSHPTVLHLMVAQLHDNLVGGFNHSEKY